MSETRRVDPRLTEKPQYTEASESEELREIVRNHNEAMKGKGLKYLRSFLSNVVTDPRYAAAKPLLDAVNKANGEGGAAAISIAKDLLAQTYASPEEHLRMCQIAYFVKKYPFPGSEKSRKTNAQHRFLRGERRNHWMNLLTRARRRANGYARNIERSDAPVSQLINDDRLELMRSYIRRVIGDAPRLSDVLSLCKWGPGSTVGVNGQFTNFARKLLAEEWTVTPAAIDYAITACKRLPMFWEVLGLTRDRKPAEDGGTPIICVDPQSFEERMRARLRIVQHNKIAYVSKDASTDRTIASEPTLNQFLQLAVNEFMVKRLKHVGINLRDQKRNQQLAWLGSCIWLVNRYSTIDLKNASGSIYVEIVRELFPPAWFELLNALRSPSYRCDDLGEKRYSSFASMGNGFCFPVETLIFASICHAACALNKHSDDFTVYGDDIIVREAETPAVLETLRWLGFETNADKTFTKGPFRESCGADWYNGEWVRPIYIDDALDTFEQRIRAHNAFVRGSIDQEFLSTCCRNWFPPFSSKFVRPLADTTDEAIDGRFANITRYHIWNTTHRIPAWYGLKFSAKADLVASRHDYSNVALMYGALRGSSSETPFAARRETSLAVSRFSHGGGNSLWLPSVPARR